MNIFAVDPCPAASARALHDAHVVKMTLESAQLLCGPHSGAPMKRTHWNHPCAVWARASRGNYAWLLDHALALAAEYRERFKRQHGALPAILWCTERVEVVSPPACGSRLTRAARKSNLGEMEADRWGGLLAMVRFEYGFLPRCCSKYWSR